MQLELLFRNEQYIHRITRFWHNWKDIANNIYAYRDMKEMYKLRCIYQTHIEEVLLDNDDSLQIIQTKN